MNNQMDRRGFLKAMGVLLGMAVLPSSLVAEVPARILPPQKPKPAPKPIEGEWGYFDTGVYFVNGEGDVIYKKSGFYMSGVK